jgi:hypothetical protein
MHEKIVIFFLTVLLKVTIDGISGSVASLSLMERWPSA